MFKNVQSGLKWYLKWSHFLTFDLTIMKLITEKPHFKYTILCSHDTVLSRQRYKVH